MSSSNFLLMLQFVDRENGTGFFSLRLPFVKSGYLYGTDGTIAARVKTDAKDTEIPGITFPDASIPFNSVKRCDPSPVPLPTVGDDCVCLRDTCSIRVRYWNEIINLPGVRLASEINPGEAILFVFDFDGDGDGELAVAPLKSDHYDDEE